MEPKSLAGDHKTCERLLGKRPSCGSALAIAALLGRFLPRLGTVCANASGPFFWSGNRSDRSPARPEGGL